MRARRSLGRAIPLVITVAATGFGAGCGSSATGTGSAIDPLETPPNRQPSTAQLGPGPGLDLNDRLVRLADGSCELRPRSGPPRAVANCPVEIQAGSASMIRRWDGICFLEYDCPSAGPPAPPCNPPEPTVVACPEGSPSVVISRNPPAVSR